MTLALRVNLRHKAAFFVTLVAAGAILIFGDTMKISLGIILLGVAFAWAFFLSRLDAPVRVLIDWLFFVLQNRIHFPMARAERIQ